MNLTAEPDRMVSLLTLAQRQAGGSGQTSGRARARCHLRWLQGGSLAQLAGQGAGHTPLAGRARRYPFRAKRNAVPGGCPVTCFLPAAGTESLAWVRLLLDSGADANLPDATLMVPLSYACQADVRWCWPSHSIPPLSLTATGWHGLDRACRWSGCCARQRAWLQPLLRTSWTAPVHRCLRLHVHSPPPSHHHPRICSSSCVPRVLRNSGQWPAQALVLCGSW
jgi:hypothetical protein